MEPALHIVALLAGVAFVAGAIDAVAGGGGLLTIPALLAAGVPPVSAVATNKLQSCLGTGSAVLAFWRRGHLDPRRIALPALFAFVGSGLGAWVLQRVDPSFLKAFVPLLLLAMGGYFLLAPKLGEADRQARVGPPALALVVAVIGFYDGFFGPGAGSFLFTAMVALGGLGVVRGIAHSKCLNLVTNIAGLGVLVIGGKVLWLTGAAMAAASICGNQLGAWFAMRHKGRGVRPLLVLMSFALTLRLLADPANPLWAVLRR